MKTRFWTGSAFFGLASLAGAALADPLSVNPLFADHMVLQRNRPVSVTGKAPPGATVTIRFAGVSAQAAVDQAGRWRATLPPLSDAQGVIEIEDSTGGSLNLTDVVTGDVFLCSGQSNMDLAVSDTSYPRRTADEAEGLAVRILKIRRTSSPRPEPWAAPEIAWGGVGPTTLPGFSAACWHMGRTMSAADVGVPIGLVQASWGGASIEDWLSPGALGALPAYADAERLLNDYADDPASARTERIVATEAWARSADPGSDAFAEAAFDDSGWPEIGVPGSWERSGVQELTGFDGVMWFRRDLSLTADQAGRSALLRLGRIDERDQVWVNGQIVGATMVASEARGYAIPAGLLRPGHNAVAVRVVDERGSGGFLGRPGDLSLELEGAAAIEMAGAWRYRSGVARRDWATEPPFVPWAAPGGVSTMWNGMIAPLDGFSFKGVAWYQGESNAAKSEAYGQLLEVWAKSWRDFFDDPEMALVVAQLPGFGPRTAGPSDGDWARLREAQRRVALNDTRMGLAVLIDLGVSYDIHPAHKDEAGRRLGQEMLRIAYGRDVPAAPSPTAAESSAEGTVVQFINTGGGLVAYGSHDAVAFELCDAQGACRFVSAQVEGDRVRLPAAPDAREVRYAWQGSPPINLYGATGLPVVPFSIAIQPAVLPSGDR